LHRVSNDDLQEAAMRGDPGLVRRLIHAGASVNAPMVLEYEDEIVTLLHVLALKPEVPNGTRIIGEIVKANADINARSSTGSTPLICASKLKHLGAVEALIAVKADAVPEDDLGGNALGYAVQLEAEEGLRTKPGSEDLSCEVVKMLSSVSGVNFDNGGTGFNPPVVEAVKQHGSFGTNLVLQLLEFGATPDGLPEATITASVGLVKILIKALANPFVKDDAGKTAVKIAAERGHAEITRLLRDHIAHLKEINHGHVQNVPSESPVESPEVTDDWIEYHDPATNQKYYYSAEQRRATWTDRRYAAGGMRTPEPDDSHLKGG
jgi:ankyrin repeat protein